MPHQAVEPTPPPGFPRFRWLTGVIRPELGWFTGSSYKDIILSMNHGLGIRIFYEMTSRTFNLYPILGDFI